MLEYFPSIHKFLGSIPNTAKRKRKNTKTKRKEN
jgi:hypothetical protein